MNIKNNILFNNPESYWIASTESNKYPKLDKNIKTDIAIIGGGIVGITTAYLLSREGFDVVLVEADKIGLGTTGHTTAKLTSQHGLIYNKLKNSLGKEKARLYAEANESAISFLSTLIENESIDCDFSRKSAYIYTRDENYIKDIENEVNAALSLGLQATYQDEVPLPFSIKAAVRFDNQAQFHPLKYLMALASKAEKKGARVFEDTEAIDIVKDEDISVVTRKGNKITASKVVVASHYPFFDKKGLYFTRLFTERSYVVGIKAKEKFPEAMFINAEQPTRSLRSHFTEKGEIILVIGDNHKTGHGPDTGVHYENLKNFAEKNFTIEDIPYYWSTQDCMTLDGVPYVGRLTSDVEDIYVATGFGKWGMSNGIAASILIKDLIAKGENPWQYIYDPSRFTPMASAKNFLKGNFDVAGSFIGGKIIPSKDSSDLKVGEAKTIETENGKIGMFKDEDGKIYYVDTTCTHLGCELKWNSVEKSWDCPCHGSRFSYTGEVMEGPATKPLKRY